ncbi:hypothetical protein QAD02_021371 [Eretmocerus hayati]|uniref:Uncharacterized protein n=1 Tax=Eretmocerus hayati TaxID=131215 RepID=A0ACC2PR39_9HYME|nr:hypothetical protein QAD02_021371 [Eretmocerus hayati]
MSAKYRLAQEILYGTIQRYPMLSFAVEEWSSTTSASEENENHVERRCSNLAGLPKMAANRCDSRKNGEASRSSSLALTATCSPSSAERRLDAHCRYRRFDRQRFLNFCDAGLAYF